MKTSSSHLELSTHMLSVWWRRAAKILASLSSKQSVGHSQLIVYAEVLAHGFLSFTRTQFCTKKIWFICTVCKLCANNSLVLHRLATCTTCAQHVRKYLIMSVVYTLTNLKLEFKYCFIVTHVIIDSCHLRNWTLLPTKIHEILIDPKNY